MEFQAADTSNPLAVGSLIQGALSKASARIPSRIDEESVFNSYLIYSRILILMSKSMKIIISL